MENQFKIDCYADRLNILYANLNQSILVTLMVILVLASIQYDVAAHSILTSWILVQLLVLIGRFWLGLRFARKAPMNSDLRKWGRRFFIGAVSTGLVWGAAGLVFFPSNSIALQVFTVLVLAGLAAGALTVLAADFPSYAAYACTTLLPVTVNSAIYADRLHIAISVLTFSMLIFLLRAAKRFNGSIKTSLHLRYENRELMQQLECEKKRLDNRLTRILQDFSSEIYLVDLNTLDILQSNAGASRNLGYSEQELLQLSLSDVHPGIDQAVFLGLVESSSEADQGAVAFRGDNRRRDGTLYPVEMRLQVVTSEDPPICLVTMLDMSERFHYEEKLRYQANYDQLTGLPNKVLALTRASQAFERCLNNNTKLALMFLDLDNFKTINDTLGHKTGDQLLQMVAERLNQVLRTSDTAARIGGDEFIILIPDVVELSCVEKVAHKIIDTITPPFLLDNRELYVTASIGISFFPDDGNTAEKLLQHADTAMYNAKAQGKNNFQFFSREMKEMAARHLLIESKLRKALELDELEIHFQPQLDTSSGILLGAEALLRWNNQVLGQVSPGEFIPVAENSGLILPLGNWVLEQACMEAARWPQTLGRPLRVAVNVSSPQFQDGGLVEKVKESLEKSCLPPEYLELEITESLLMAESSNLMGLFQQLLDLGVKLSLDDFGTGYSSLSYLKRFPIHTLKIDQSFIRELHTDQNDQSLVTAIVAMAHGLNIEVVAEGVECDEQLEFLRQREVDIVQGFLLSKPLSADNFRDYLAQQCEVPVDASVELV
ncbi:putative bifunctional diguanylate cyclase/phosphodiesterase [Candidatus Endoriftia persephonae]|jgi:diguanylate cyclase (GGDEF)-like protein/PAS domain S-box-containing protein|uniref:cyclic-guanylate-specific phosphodiesterase n=2 Tax=Gammaproteobacteria TaxID=1236 RepID=G2FFM0_9GAMM|nr:GGDEF and EAL domain-containing protein [Candidatus Endoriftia persephone]EGW54436.1 diguanylate cyclase/phosphodiesterase with PAS/PAC sensor(S) [endosymbiont of Tevnia jerichonana (vent Tica)]USF87192.1 EAL domain-containing protein [Candidatus Endoriftia persephone]